MIRDLKKYKIKNSVQVILGVLCILIWVPLPVKAQQWHQSSLASFNKYRDFAAYGGLDRVTAVGTQYRTQWDGVSDNPRMLYIGASSPMYEWGGAVGFDIQNNRDGYINLTRFRGSYNYVLSTPIGFLSLGGRLSLNSLNLDGNKIRTPDGNYEDGNINHNDPLLSRDQMSGFGLGWDVSAYFVGKKIQAGLSIAELPSGLIRANSFSIEMRRNITSIVQYRTRIKESLFWQPGLLVRTDLAVLQTEIYNHFSFRNDYTFGVNLRGYNSSSIDAIAFVFGYRLNDSYSFYYSYDFGMSEFRKANEGSHDIILRINFRSLSGQGVKPPLIYNPRFL